MWESSVPINNEISNQLNVTTNRQLINPLRNTSADQGFQTCRSLINHFDDQSSDDEQVLSDDEDQGGITPKVSKRKGPNSFVLQLHVQDIHLAANAPSVKN
jgi:hypothetical protein